MLTYWRVQTDRLLATCFLAMLMGGCVSAPDVDSFALPYFAYVPLRNAGITDERNSFARTFCSILQSDLEPEYGQRPCTDFLHLDEEIGLPESPPTLNPELPLKVIIVPGFLGDCLATYTTPFEEARQSLRTDGIETELLMVGGRASSSHNAELIAARLESDELRNGPPVVLIGYSKGIVDILEALPQVAGGIDHVAAVVSVAGAVNGSPIASEQSGFMRALLEALPSSGCPRSPDDGDAIQSLAYQQRQYWLDENSLDPAVQYFSIAAYGSEADMSRVNKDTYKKLSQIDDRNDGQIIYRDALIPDGVLLAFVRADHLAVALPFNDDDGFMLNYLVNKNAFPRGVLLRAALISVQESISRSLARGL